MLKLLDANLPLSSIDLKLLIEHAQKRVRTWASDEVRFSALILEAFGAKDSPPARHLREMLLNGNLTVAVEMLSSQHLQGIRGAYTSSDPNGEERIYLNAGWLAKASSAEAEAVLLEEFGHAIDHRLDGAVDTPGDEGERFSALIRDLTPSTKSAAENDHSTINIRGTHTSVESSADAGGSWEKLGLDIDGEAAGDRSGQTIALSDDGSVIVIGAVNNDGDSGNANDNRGHVRIYNRNVAGGREIDGVAANDQASQTIAISGDGSVVAIGSLFHDETRGHVRLFNINATDGEWTKIGADIDGLDAGHFSGGAISLSYDGSIVAIGSIYGTTGKGEVRTYRNNSINWELIGSPILGQADMDHFGSSVSLSADGDRLAVGAPMNGNGYVRIFENTTGSSWIQLGETIRGEELSEATGTCVELSRDGTFAAIGAPWNDRGRGKIRFFSHSEGSWTQTENVITGEAEGDQAGEAISLAKNGDIVAIGSKNHDGSKGNNSGKVRYFIQAGNLGLTEIKSFEGEAAGDQAGSSVAISADGSIISFGADGNDGGTEDQNDDRGHVQTHKMVTTANIPFSIDLADESDTGASKTDNITTDATPTITGSIESRQFLYLTITLYEQNAAGEILRDNPLGTTTAEEIDNEGKINWTINSSRLSGGDHSLIAIATDSVGNTMGSSSILNLEIKVDEVVPDGVISIPAKRFLDEGITSASLPESLLTIEESAFALNPALTNIEIPNSVLFIGDFAFESTGLTAAEIGNSVHTIGEAAFKKTKLSSIRIPDSVLDIGKHAFSESPLDEGVILSNSITAIEEGTFQNTELKEITIPDSVLAIGKSAFAESPLEEVIIGSSVKQINDSAFKNTKITTIIVPDLVEEIGASAFKGTPLNNVSLGSSLHTIRENAFKNTKITSIIIPDSVKEIGASAFSETEITKVTVPHSAIIGENAFDNNVAINRSPIANRDTNKTIANEPLNIVNKSGLLANDSDLDESDSITIAEINGETSNLNTAITGSDGGIFTIQTDGSYVFDPTDDFIDLGVKEDDQVLFERTTSINYTISDRNGGNSSSTLSITVSAGNHAPLANGNPTLESVQEDTLNPAGDTVANLLSSSFSDIDEADSLFGIAITANGESGSQGDWQYSSNNGSTWNSIPTEGLSDSTALYLRSDNKLRFLAEANFNGTPGHLTLRLIDNSAFSTSKSPFGIGVVIGSAAPTFADLDNDGDLDAFVGGGSPEDLISYENTGSNTEPAFAKSSDLFGVIDDFHPMRKIRPCFADLDGDGDLDLVYGTQKGRIVMRENTGSANAPQFARSTDIFGRAIQDVGDSATPTFADLDDDGDVDLLSGTRLGEVIYFQNIGNASSPFFFREGPTEQNQFISSIKSADLIGGSSPQLVDYDQDGDFDAFIGNSEGEMLYYENTGTASDPQFASASKDPFEITDLKTNGAKPAFADLDGDGDLDAFIGDGGGEITYFENRHRPIQHIKSGELLDVSINGGFTQYSSESINLTTSINAVNDTPNAADNTANAIAGTSFNKTPENGLLSNAADVEAGETLTIATIRTGAKSVSGVNGVVGESLIGFYGTLTVSADGSYTYSVDSISAAILKEGDIVNETFTYTVSDGSSSDNAELMITITGVNDLPIASNNSGSVNEGESYDKTSTLGLLSNASDIDAGETLTIATIRTGTKSDTGVNGVIGESLIGTYGTVNVSADGSYSYSANQEAANPLKQGDIVKETFTYTVSDGSSADSAELTITISGVNDAPIAARNRGRVKEGKTYDKTTALGLLSNASDIDADETLTIASIRTGAESDSGVNGVIGESLIGTYGTLNVAADGSYTYSADQEAANPLKQGDIVKETFTYTVSDGSSADTAELTIRISGVNDAPIAANNSGSVTEGESYDQTSALGLLSNASDVDAGDTLTIASIRTGAESDSGVNGIIGESLTGPYGTLTVAADGSYTYSADQEAANRLKEGDIVNETYTYTVSDGTSSDTAELEITIAGVNESPVLSIKGIAAIGQRLTATLSSNDVEGDGRREPQYIWQSSSDDGSTWKRVGRNDSIKILQKYVHQQLRIKVNYLDAEGSTQSIRRPIGKVSAGLLLPIAKEDISTNKLSSPFTIGELKVRSLVIGTTRKDTLTGTKKVDLITGYQRRDTLSGGEGDSSDVFLLSTDQIGKRHADQITGFNGTDGDLIALDLETFRRGERTRFKAVRNKKDLDKFAGKHHDLLYNKKNGCLYVNANRKADGFGADGGLLAKLKGKPLLEKANIEYIEILSPLDFNG